MSGFIKYHHIERYGQDEVLGIDLGDCWIFPKLDGTNSSVWLDDGEIRAGSRNRELSLEKDNAGFLQWIQDSETGENLFLLLKDHPSWNIYGEWLVPHSLKTYREDVWRRFWIFDVFCKEKGRLMSYEEYSYDLEEYSLDIIDPLMVLKNASEESLRKIMEQNTFLIKDGEGAGEGIVIKNYIWTSKFGRQTWAKMVRNEFKEQNSKTFGVTVRTGTKQIEAEIALKFVTKAFVDKTRAKLELEIKEIEDRKTLIPRLLQTCYHDIITEELWNILKKRKNPVIDFKLFHHHVIYRVKQHAQDLF
jgi:hypothetical protein